MSKEKSKAELEIEALADVFNIAGDGFEDFYKEAKEKDMGNYSTAASSGYSSKAASSGNYSKAASSGDSSKAASAGEHSACASLGYRAAVSGDIGNLIMASEYIRKDDRYIPVGGKANLVDGKKIKAGCWYIVEGGEWVEVDYTDGIFSRVVSTRSGVKKVKTDNGDVMFVVTDGTNSAHGKTIKEARDDLAFKAASRDVSQFNGMKLTEKKTPAEWAFVYRAITGACQSGTQSFMATKGKLKAKYTLSEILEQTSGAFGHGKFKEIVIGASQ